MKKTLLICILLIAFFNKKSFAQLNIKVEVQKISVLTASDCDAGVSDNSDFLFEFKATDNSAAALTNNTPTSGSIGMCNYAVVNENNGPFAIFTATPGLAVFSPANGIFFNHSYNCIQQVPTMLTLMWRGYENDDATAPSVLPVASGTTAISTVTVALTANTTSTVQSVLYTQPSLDGSCPQTYEITFKVTTSTGSFYPLNITDVDATQICAAATNGQVEGHTFGGSGTVFFDWSNDGINDFDDGSAVFNLPVGSYTLVVKDGLNCTDTAVAVITSVGAPTALGAFITSTSTLCAGSTNIAYSVPSQANTTYNWNYTAPGVTIVGSGNSVTLDFSNTALSGTLSVYAQNSCSITPTLTLPITVTPKPAVSISGNTSVCDNAQETLTAAGATTYTWSTGVNTSSITIAQTATVIYTVSGTLNGCIGTSSQFTVTVSSSPTVQVSGTSLTVCPNQTVALTSNGNGSLFVWSDGFIGANHTVLSSATVIYTVSNILNSCIKQATYTLNVHPLPVISVSGNTIVCPGKPLNLTATGADTYNWSTGSSNVSITYTPSGLTTLTVTGTNTLTGCSKPSTVNVNTYPAGLVAITGNTAICNTLSGVLTVSGSYFYLWSNGATANTTTISPTAPTTISVVGTTLDGCKDSASVAIGVINNLSISITGADTICYGQSTTLNASVSGATTYSWNTGAVTQSITVSPASTFTYIVTASNPGCTGSKAHEVFVKTLPHLNFNLITPICSNGGFYTMNATPVGGVYIGSGISGNTFDPSVGLGNHSITYQVTGSNGCTASSTQTIDVITCVGIDEKQAENFMNVYPNPSQGKVNVSLNTYLKAIIVFDYTGKIVKQFEYVNSQQAEIDLSSFASGMYTFVVSANSGSSKTVKIIKQ